MCQYSNVGLWLILVEQFIMHNSLNVGVGSGGWACSSHFNELVLPSSGVIMGGWTLQLWRMLLGFWVIAINSNPIICDYLQNEFCASFKPPLKVLAYAQMILLMLLTEQAWHTDTCWDCYSKCYKWPKWYVNNSTNIGCSVFVNKFLHSEHVSICFAHHSLTRGAETFLRSRQLCTNSRTSQHFMEPKGSLPCSEESSDWILAWAR
jgi:hypothetical protein